ncbi:MAG: protein kinase domain-containing protein, partial [Amnibacterium sp.]
VFDQGQDDGLAYLVMEYLQGITLRDLLGEYGRLTPDQTMDILEAVLAGLVAAHKAGIIHRDLKPENVLLADDGRIKIGDFGLARAATSHTASGQALLGTIAYLSPELVTRGIADTRSDVYAVGIMMYEMLTGEQPFKGEQPVQIAYQHANDSVPAPSLKNPEVPAALDDLTLWATARDPEQRPRDARAMLDQLFETQHLIRDGRSATGPQQRTTVLPAATTRIPAVRPSAPAPRPRTAAVPVGAPTRLAMAAARAKRRGAWTLVVVLVAGLLAAGTGWWLGGSAASAHAAGSRPAVALAGTTSRAVPVPIVTGERAAAAGRLLEAAGFRVGPEAHVASARPAGRVVRVTGDSGAPLPPGATLPVGTRLSLVVSAGPAA